VAEDRSSWPDWRLAEQAEATYMAGFGAPAVDGDLACFSGAATLESHRGRGAQRAFMARRLTDAAAAGVRTVGTETWSETSEAKNPSLHNMHWAGFRTVYQRVNHVRRLG
jgi:hypothetical protein